jgi:hypothetical protein
MFSQFFKKTYQKISFEDLQFAIKSPRDFIIINTLHIGEQDCLIKNTISYQLEENIINDLVNQYDFKSKRIIVYGKNSSDVSIEKKYDQLVNLGFVHVFMFVGGLFEWLLLQDIYGDSEFPTTRKTLDILKYKPTRSFGGLYIGYG